MSNITLSPAATTIAGLLLEIEAIRLSPDKPFTWASGWKSPIYCDNRLSLSYPAVRSYIKELLVANIQKQFPEAEAIAGVATAGIPQGVLVAEMLDLPFLYVRSKPKGHGMENLIEGKATPGQKVVVLEDLISTGGSSLKSVEALRAAKVEVLGMAAIFTYGFPVAQQNFENAGVDLMVLSDYATMLEEAIGSDYVNENVRDLLSAWREAPDKWQP
ncbi:MAG TPA: orotate phosphoribosyltransferase [Cytophagales bacterium]|nr:orotate phosphoribosyltransferase [Cytophagales bacterium]